MTNLIIGLCVGIAACIALMIMWRMAETLRHRLDSQDRDRPEKRTPASRGLPADEE